MQPSPPANDSLRIESLHHLSVVLVSPRNSLNIGAVARAMSNFGCSDLRVVKIFDKEFRSAVSAVGPAAQVLANAREFDSIADAVADAHLVVGTSGAPSRHLETPVHRLEEGSLAVRSQLRAGHRVALLLGSEKTGLSNDDLSRCHVALRIPTRDEHPSMNLGQAAALCLYELARKADLQPIAPPSESTSAGAIDRFTTLLQEAMNESGYPDTASPAHAQKLRQLVLRLHLNDADASLLTGILRQILWRLRLGQTSNTEQPVPPR